MKKTILTITAAMALLFASCGNNSKTAEGEASDTTAVATPEAAPEAEASIAGAWKMSDMQVDMEIPKGKEQAFEDMKKKMVEATVYTFNEDGTMSFKNHLVKETTGVYTYEGGKLVVTSDKTKKTDTLTVDELSADKLVISAEQGGKKAVMTFSK